MLQLGKVSIKLGAANGGGGVIRVGHMCHQIIQQGSFGGIGELAIGIAPLTIILVKGTIRPFAQGGIMPQHWQTRVRGLPNRVLMETSNSWDSSFSVSVLGTVSPVSLS